MINDSIIRSFLEIDISIIEQYNSFIKTKQNSNELAFLDAFIWRLVCLQLANSDVYVHWNSLTPVQ